MSKLYLTGRTDKKKYFTASGNRHVDIDLGFDESDSSKKINVRLNVPDNTGLPTIWVDGRKACEITKDGVLHCGIKKYSRLI